MADFCKQCSEKLFGKDFGDLAGITKPDEQAVGNYALVICEECGWIIVDVNGRCVSAGCLEKHGEEFV